MNQFFCSIFTVSVLILGLTNALPIRNLPGVGPTKTRQFADFITVNATLGSNIFYWLVEAANSPETAPVTLWLNGGPGVSSLLGFFAENGPYNIQEDGTLKTNKHSWHLHSNMIYIDQPVGSGYSYTLSNEGFPTTQDEVARDLYATLQGIFRTFPNLSKNEFYITGESYAGKYIPSLSNKIYVENLRGVNPKINLKGLAIGNGWVHPIVQNEAYVNYPYNLGLINTRQMQEAQQIQDKLLDAIKTERWVLANNYSNALEAFVVNAAGGIDQDDIRDASSRLNPLIAACAQYLNRDDVRKALYTFKSSQGWNFANSSTEHALDSDEQKSVLYLLPNLIAHYRVLIYTGNMDLNCNLVGVESYLDAMEWDLKTAFFNAPRGSWKANGKLAGYARSIGDLKGPSLTNVIVRNSGHEVPYYQPENALDLFRRFVTGSDWTKN